MKSLALHHPDAIDLDASGVASNRRFYFTRGDGHLLAGLHHGPLVQLRAVWDAAADRLSIAFPDGREVSEVVRTSDPVSTDFWGRTVAGRLVAGPWNDALTAFAGFPVKLVKADLPGGGVDVEPVTISSTASAAEVARRAGVAAVDGRRFRMLIELDGCSPHEEDGWTGTRLRLGASVVLEISGPVPRCATTTHDPATGVRDLDTLRTIAGYRGRRAGKHIDFGVYARVIEPGRARVGDPVTILA